jgi:exodeoxyribonuclease-5
MILTTKQEEGLKIAVARYKAGEAWTCISGYAGSGKSTLVKFIIAALDVDPESVCYVAYTGKAATVLRQKGCENAMTAHKLLYKAYLTPEGKYMYTPKDSFEQDYQILVVDEVSMLPKEMWHLLLSHRIYVLALGDPGQLPPVNPEDDNHVLDNPHVFLDEIMRQAQESEIIRLSMHVREGLPLSSFKATGAQVQIFPSYQVSTGMYEWADQILCATNATRASINSTMRELRGYGPTPEIGDKIISEHNHWNTESVSGDWALTNGTIGTLTEYATNKIWLPSYISKTPLEIMTASFDVFDTDEFIDVDIDYKKFLTGEATLNPKQKYQMKKAKRCPEAPYEFDYAYAITCHKAQGSEWDKVMVIEESFPTDPIIRKRWLYTAATRAKEKLVLITK